MKIKRSWFNFDTRKTKKVDLKKEALLDIKIFVDEECGHKGSYNAFSYIPYHSRTWERVKIENKRGIVERTFCSICKVYWDTKYKKLK